MPASEMDDSITFERRAPLPCLFLTVFLLAAVGLTGCAQKRAAQTTGADKRTAPTSMTQEKPRREIALRAEFQEARLLWDDEKGRRVWEARFDDAVASGASGDTVAELHGVKASLYEDGKVVSSLIAPRVIADSRSGEVRAAGGVTITSALDGASVRSDRVTWKSREDKMYGAGAVRMTRGNISIAANTFEADSALRTATLK